MKHIKTWKNVTEIVVRGRKIRIYDEYLYTGHALVRSPLACRAEPYGYSALKHY